jgi:uncharacterized protein DUF4154
MQGHSSLIRLRLLTIFLCFLIVLTKVAPPVSTAADVFEEYDVKAAFIYNFTKFITWPAKSFVSDEAPFVVGIFGENPFGDALNLLKDKTVKGHPIEIRFVNNLNEAPATHVLFICASEKDKIQKICNSTNAPVLTIGDAEGFCDVGGIIHLTTVDNKIRFKINQKAARRAGLYISSHLLQLAISNGK